MLGTEFGVSGLLGRHATELDTSFRALEADVWMEAVAKLCKLWGTGMRISFKEEPNLGYNQKSNTFGLSFPQEATEEVQADLGQKAPQQDRGRHLRGCSP